MKVSQMNIMVILNGLGPSRAADICKYLQMDPSTISRNLDRMRENEWLIVKSGEGKSQIVTISANGYKKLEEVDPDWQIAQQKAEAILGESALESIMEVGNDILFCRHKVLNGGHDN
jgi:DNA-binding MarR family transcriptional regulator